MVCLVCVVNVLHAVYNELYEGCMDVKLGM